MYDTSRFHDLKPGEIAGMRTINPAMQFLRNIRSTQSHVHIDGNPAGGIDIAVDVPQSGSGADFSHAFQPSISGDALVIGAGLAMVGTFTGSTSSQTYQVGAPGVVPASTWTIDPQQQLYYEHIHQVVTYQYDSSGAGTYTTVSTVTVERASAWPYWLRQAWTGPDTYTYDENVPLFEIAGTSGSYYPVVYNFGTFVVCS